MHTVIFRTVVIYNVKEHIIIYIKTFKLALPAKFVNKSYKLFKFLNVCQTYLRSQLKYPFLVNNCNNTEYIVVVTQYLINKYM